MQTLRFFIFYFVFKNLQPVLSLSPLTFSIKTLIPKRSRRRKDKNLIFLPFEARLSTIFLFFVRFLAFWSPPGYSKIHTSAAKMPRMSLLYAMLMVKWWKIFFSVEEYNYKYTLSYDFCSNVGLLIQTSPHRIDISLLFTAIQITCSCISWCAMIHRNLENFVWCLSNQVETPNKHLRKAMLQFISSRHLPIPLAPDDSKNSSSSCW